MDEREGGSLIDALDDVIDRLDAPRPATLAAYFPRPTYLQLVVKRQMVAAQSLIALIDWPAGALARPREA